MDDSTRSSDTSLFEAYPIRIQIALVVSLVLLLVAINLPLEESVNRVGWSASSSIQPPEQITLSETRPEKTGKETSGEQREGTPPQTDMQQQPDERSVATSRTDNSDPTTNADTASSDPEFTDVRPVAALSLEDQQPRIVGGLGALYLNIRYPEKAREKGIEGRMKLEFTVLRDGEVTNIDVVDSLHPLCDSAAVQGVRSVRFVPARQNGDPVPIRMSLPVRFQIVSMGDGPQTADLEQ